MFIDVRSMESDLQGRVSCHRAVGEWRNVPFKSLHRRSRPTGGGGGLSAIASLALGRVRGIQRNSATHSDHGQEEEEAGLKIDFILDAHQRNESRP